MRGYGLLEKSVENKVYFYLHNEHGDVTRLVDQAEKTVNSYEYDVFGNSVDKKEGIRNSFRYASEQYDTATGQYYLRARFYNPATSRMLSEDPHRGDGLNLYTYVQNNPLVWIDPSGMASTPLYGTGNQTVYGIFDINSNTPSYVGITNDFNRRQGEHQKPVAGKTEAKLDITKQVMKPLNDIPNNGQLDYAPARAYEQDRIETYGTLKNENGNAQNSFVKTREDDRGVAYKNEYDEIQKEKAKAKAEGGCNK